MSGKRGGRRPRAGAQRGNRTAVKTLRSSEHFWVSEAMKMLADGPALAVGARWKRYDPEAEDLVERLRRRDPAAWRELPAIAARWELEGSGISVLRRPENDQTTDPRAFVYTTVPGPENDQTAPPTPPANKRSNAPVPISSRRGFAEVGAESDVDRCVRLMAEWGFRPAPRLWVKTHEDWIDTVESYLELLDSMSSEELRGLDHPMKYLNGSVHLEHEAELTDLGGKLWCPQAPRCRWSRKGAQAPQGEHEETA